MSTLNSTNMTISRPTSRVLAPPGGGSSINIFGGGGGDDAPATKTTKPAFNPSFEPSKPVVEETPMPQEEVVTPTAPVTPAVTKPAVGAAAPAPEPVVVAAKPAPVAVAPVTVVAATTTGAAPIGVVAVGAAAGSAADATLKARVMAVLAARGVAQVCLAEVCDAMQLPAAAKRMAASGKVGAVLALAALTEEGCLGKEMAAAVASGLVAASVAAPGCPIVPGLLVAPTEQAAVAKAADAPVAWVAAAMGVAKQGGEQEAVAFTVVPTGAAVTTMLAAVPTTVEAAAPVVCATPEKAMSDLSLKGTASKVLEEGTPGRRVRGAGPSSIIFG